MPNRFVEEAIVSCSTMATQTGIAIDPIGCISLLTDFRLAHSNDGHAEVAELADALGSGPSELTMLVQVQVLSSALLVVEGSRSVGRELVSFPLVIREAVLILDSRPLERDP